VKSLGDLDSHSWFYFKVAMIATAVRCGSETREV
jgi:hypothetical protein